MHYTFTRIEVNDNNIMMFFSSSPRSRSRNLAPRRKRAYKPPLGVIALFALSIYSMTLTFTIKRQIHYEPEGIALQPLPPKRSQSNFLAHDIDYSLIESRLIDSDDFESPQEPSPTAKMANQLLRSKGVLLRYDERHTPDRYTPSVFDKNGTDYVPASFVHASMQAPNVMFLGWPEEGEGWFEKGPRVSYLIGSKFEPEASCRAYYPNDADSQHRNHHIKDNPLGTSCTGIQKRFQNRFHDLYNVTNG